MAKKKIGKKDKKQPPPLAAESFLLPASQPTPPPVKPESMEVHAHTHTPLKKWNHYLFEFLMLFLAVLAGFLAENLREHRIEHKREKEMMNAMLHDLKSDLYQIDSLKGRRMKRNRDCDSLIYFLKKPATSTDLIYFYGRNASRRIHFRPQNGTLLQLRSSGGFRVIHDTAVLNAINAYELQLAANAENIEVEEKELTEYSNVAAKVFDVSIFQEITKGGSIQKPVGNPALFSSDRTVLNELGIKLHYWKRTSLSVLERLNILEETGGRLVELIKKEYHLK